MRVCVYILTILLMYVCMHIFVCACVTVRICVRTHLGDAKGLSLTRRGEGGGGGSSYRTIDRFRGPHLFTRLGSSVRAEREREKNGSFG